MNTLNPYIGWNGESQEDGAVLIFAQTARQARKLAFGVVSGWFDVRYTDIRVRRLREHADYVTGMANPEKYAAGEAHCVDDPRSCDRCETWGIPLLETGICATCAQDGDQ